MLGAGLVRSRKAQVVGMCARLHLDHLGAHVGKNARDEGAGADPAEIEDAQIGELHRSHHSGAGQGAELVLLHAQLADKDRMVVRAGHGGGRPHAGRGLR